MNEMSPRQIPVHCHVTGEYPRILVFRGMTANVPGIYTWPWETNADREV